MFYAFRVMLDNDYTSIKLNDRLLKYVQNYWLKSILSFLHFF
jgi:hypothetical protein